MLTIEGERDDISGIGQTRAAHAMTSNLKQAKREHIEQPEVGHYGLFNGRRFRTEIAPAIKGFMQDSTGDAAAFPGVICPQAQPIARGGSAMLGLMQDQKLLISSIIKHAARHHGRAELVSKTVEGDIHRTNYAGLERRARRLVRALQRLGIHPADRVATLAWNGYRHMELYYAVSGMQAVCHTINPRLSQDDIAFIINDAADVVLFAETSFAALIAAVAPRIPGVRAVVFMTERQHMPDMALPPGMDLLCYEEIMAAADEDYAWPEFDERCAASLCYTSGTTGKPKGVLYSHRSTMLHAMAINSPDAFGLRAVDRLLPVVPMFHVNAWGTPYAAPMAGTTLIMPGRHLDGASLTALMNDERVTFSAGVPTVWLGLLNHLRATGQRLETVQRLVVGGSACPRMLMEAFGDEYGVRLDHAWGMSEMSPLGTYNTPTAANVDLPAEDAMRLREKQGRALFGVDMRIVDDAGVELPWDGEHSGHLQVRGPWVCSAYLGGTAGDAPGRRRLVRHRRRRHHRCRRLHGDHRPFQGRDQIRRRVDQLDPARKHRGLPPGGGRSRHRRRRAPEMG